MRSSLSCARRRRLRCLPSPAASSISRRRSRGLEVTIASTRPCETTECISLPRPVSRQHLEHVDEAAARAVEPVLALAAAVEAAQDRDLAHRQVDRAVGVVEDDLDLGRAARLHAAAAAEDHVLHRLAADGERRLLAHRPQHGVGDVRLARAVGPDDHATRRAPNSSRVRSGNDLKPLRVSDFRCMPAASSPRRRPSSSRSPSARAASCSACLLRPARAAADLVAPRPSRATSKVRSCGGPCSAVDVVGDDARRAAPGAPAAST